MRKTHLRSFSLAAALSAAALAGCATAMPAGRPAYVYVAENGVVTFHGETMTARELPGRMLEAGATPETHIVVVPHGDVPRAHLNAIIMGCGNAGLPNCAIRERRKISVTTGAQLRRQKQPSPQRPRKQER